MFFALKVELLQMRLYYLGLDAAFRLLLKEIIALSFDLKTQEYKLFEHFSFQLDGYYSQVNTNHLPDEEKVLPSLHDQ